MTISRFDIADGIHTAVADERIGHTIRNEQIIAGAAFDVLNIRERIAICITTSARARNQVYRHTDVRILIADGIRTQSAIEGIGYIAGDESIVTATAGRILDIEELVTCCQAACARTFTIHQINCYAYRIVGITDTIMITAATIKGIRSCTGDKGIVKGTADDVLDIDEFIALRETTAGTDAICVKQIDRYRTGSRRAVIYCVGASTTIEYIGGIIRDKCIVAATTDDVFDIRQLVAIGQTANTRPKSGYQINRHTYGIRCIADSVYATQTVKIISTITGDKCIGVSCTYEFFYIDIAIGVGRQMLCISRRKFDAANITRRINDHT